MTIFAICYMTFVSRRHPFLSDAVKIETGAPTQEKHPSSKAYEAHRKGKRKKSLRTVNGRSMPCGRSYMIYDVVSK